MTILKDQLEEFMNLDRFRAALEEISRLGPATQEMDLPSAMADIADAALRAAAPAAPAQGDTTGEGKADPSAFPVTAAPALTAEQIAGILSRPQPPLQAAPVAEPAWQLIETAPQDRPVLVCNEERGGAWIAYYGPVAGSGYCFDQPWRSLMLNCDWHKTRYAPYTPTRWQEIPLPYRHTPTPEVAPK